MAEKKLYFLTFASPAHEGRAGIYYSNLLHCTLEEVQVDAEEKDMEGYESIQIFEFLGSTNNASQVRMKDHIKSLMQIEDDTDLDVDQRVSAIVEEALNLGILIGQGKILPIN